MKNILVLAPHTDDGELGCGGTLAKLMDEGAKVTYVAFSTADQSLPKDLPKDTLVSEVKEATRVLGISPENLIIYRYEVRKLNYVRQEILEDLIKLKQANNFDMVFMPSLNDIHQDHSTIANEGLRAFKNITILGYELLWNNLQFSTQAFIKLEKKHVEKKVEALKCYNSQKGRDYVSKEFIFAHAVTRGVQIGSKYAEAFEVVRWVVE